MDNKKAPELKNEAKKLGIRRYLRMRKQELIDSIRSATNILNEEVPNIDTPILRPKKYVQVPEIKITSHDEAKRRMEIRELEEMLNLRKPKIKITNPDEVERYKKINGIKELNKRRFQHIVTQ